MDLARDCPALKTPLQGEFIAFTPTSPAQERVAETLRKLLHLRKKEQASTAGDTASPEAPPNVSAAPFSKATPTQQAQPPVADPPPLAVVPAVVPNSDPVSAPVPAPCPAVLSPVLAPLELSEEELE